MRYIYAFGALIALLGFGLFMLAGLLGLLEPAPALVAALGSFAAMAVCAEKIED